jgi:hypothetical protein
MRTLLTNVEFLHMRQLHIECSQLLHSFECAEHCLESPDSENVAVAIGLFRRAAEMQFCQQLNSTQLLDSLIGDTAFV